MTRSSRFALFLAAALILAAITPSDANAKPQNLIKYFFLNTGVQTAAQGKILFVTNKAQSFFTIKVSHTIPGTYDVVLNGALVDTIVVNADGEGKVSHRTGKGKKTVGPLPYDPRGGDLAIQATGANLLTASIPATAAEAQQKIEVEIDLTALGGVGSGEAEFRSRFGRMQFEVELEGLPVGVYDLIIGGVKVGEIPVDASGQGSIRFDTRPSSDDDDPGLALQMSFDPRGETMQVEQSAVAMFTGDLPL